MRTCNNGENAAALNVTRRFNTRFAVPLHKPRRNVHYYEVQTSSKLTRTIPHIAHLVNTPQMFVESIMTVFILG
jgi:hypothetical protein